MKQELQIALKKEKEHSEELNRHLALVRRVMGTAQKKLDLSGIKDK